jgi:hypothetical protein
MFAAAETIASTPERTKTFGLSPPLPHRATAKGKKERTAVIKKKIKETIKVSIEVSI